MTKENLKHDNPIIVIGMGEIGSVFARAFLRLGIPVFPIVRDSAPSHLAEQHPQPEMVIVAVGENDLQPVLTSIPAVWRDRLVLIQNELLPRDWLHQGIDTPTVVSVWFEKKKGQDSKIVVPSVTFGPKADRIKTALQTLDLPVETLDSEAQLLFELVRKNLYILTTNIAGLVTGGTVNELWHQHRELARKVADDVLAIQSYLTGTTLDHDALIAAMVRAFNGDPDHQCMGRSAPARLARAITLADQAGLAVPALREIALDHYQN